jgi:hypothetical protein
MWRDRSSPNDPPAILRVFLVQRINTTRQLPSIFAACRIDLWLR